MKLLVVESPSKAKTINQYLGKDYTVIASYGHIRGLPSEKGSVLPEKDFLMKFEVLEKSKNNIDNIIGKYKNCTELLLATDPDREGEAISWHMLEALKDKKVFNPKIPVKRVVFYEITKSAILQAIKNSRTINESLVAAQQARQALDYLVGFNLSPVLWRKLPGSRSAGRVQSVALRIIAERENEIECFEVQEYWSIEAEFLTNNNQQFSATLWQYNGNKLDKFFIVNQLDAEQIVQELIKSKYNIHNLEKKEIKRQPPPPFTTSTMLQEAARKLGFTAKKTSKLAQDLYEGIDINGKTEGLITYMRTDSVHISAQALEASRSVILNSFGKSYLPQNARFFKNKTKNAQEAHEAIRPTKMELFPEDIKLNLGLDHYKLYTLIWRRMLASQMNNAILNSVTLTIANETAKNLFKASGSTIKFDGFLKLYLKEKSINEGESMLPQVQIGESLETKEIKPDQHFTEPPPRYTEASLVKKLEELGIGRPSTYPSIIAVLQDRGYVKVEQKRFMAVAKGRIVNAFLTSFFEKYVDYNFTALLEDQLDEISNGKIQSKIVLKNFWDPFKVRIDEVLLVKGSDILQKMEIELSPYLFKTEEHKCKECKIGEMKLKNGKFGPFLGCSNYPNCKNIQKISDNLSIKSSKDEDLDNGSLQLPHQLGTQDDCTYTIKRGPYGVYLEAVKNKDIKRVKIPNGKDLSTIDLNYAIELALLPRVIGESKQVGIIKTGFGRFGPFVEFSGKYVSIKGYDPLTINLEEAEVIIAKKGTDSKPASTRRAYPIKKSTSPINKNKTVKVKKTTKTKKSK